MLALDHIIFYLQRRGGITRWWLQHCDLMQKSFCEQIYDCGLFKDPISDYFPYASLRSKLTTHKVPSLWFLKSVNLPSDVKVFHSSYLGKPESRVRAKTVFTFHDASELSRWSVKASIKRRIILDRLKSADVVHCISKHAKKEVLESFPQISEDKIRVIYHGTPEFPRPEIPSCLDKPFVLWVGERNGYKNGQHCFRALSLIKAIDLNLCLVGGKQLDKDEKKQIVKFKLKERVKIFPSVRTAELAWLYENAIALWYISLNEGFGFPPLEAAKFSCPTLAAAGHAVEETMGKAAIYSDRPSAEFLSEETKRLIQDTVYRKTIGSLAKKRSEYFTWTRYQNEMLSLYETLGLKVSCNGLLSCTP